MGSSYFPSFDDIRDYLSQFGPDPTKDAFTPTLGYLPSQIMRGIDEVAGLGKRGIDYLANAGYKNEPVWNPEAGMPMMAPRPGLEETPPMSTGTMLRESVLPKSDLPLDTYGRTIENLGRTGLTLAGDLGLDPAVYAMGGGGALGRAASGYFGVKGLGSAYEKGKEAIEAPDIPSAAGPALEAITYGGLGVLGAKGALGEVSPFNKKVVWKAPNELGPEAPVIEPQMGNLAPAGGFMVEPGSIRGSSTLAEHGTSYPAYLDRGESPKPSPEGAYGAGLYASQIEGEAPGYARVHGAGDRVERVGDRVVESPYNPTVVKGDVFAEKPLSLGEPAPRDLRMKAMIELNKARNFEYNPRNAEDLIPLKAEILDPNTTAERVVDIAAELYQNNIPLADRATYKGDPFSDIIKSAGYDLWGTGRTGEPAKELVIPDPRRQFKIGERYSAREEASRPVLEDTSGEPVPPIVTPNESLANPSLRVTEPPPIEPGSEYLELGPPIEKFAAKTDQIARAMGYTDIPTPGSKMAEGGIKPLSDNAIALRDLLKATKANRFTPAGLVKDLVSKGFDPADLAKELPNLLGELEQAGYLNKKATGTYTFNQAPIKGAILPSKPVHPVGPEGLSLEDALKGTIKLTSEGVGLEDINAIKKGIVEKPVSEMGSLPTEPSTEGPSEPVEPIEGKPEVQMGESKGKPGIFNIELSNGAVVPVKARSIDEARTKAEKVLAAKGSTKTVVKVTKKLSKLEEEATHEIEPVKAGTELGAQETGMSRAEQLARERAHAQELKDKMKVETDFAKAEEKRKAKEARAAEVDNLSQGLFDKITDIPKTLKSAFDISWPGRQGFFLLNRPTALKAMAKGTASFVSKDLHEATKAELASRPNAGLYQRFGLNQFEYDPTSVKEIAQRSEEYPSQGFAEKVPGVKQSERAFLDAGNRTRADMFDEFTSKFMKQGKTPENRPDLYKGLADYLNVLTLRKPLPEKMQQAGWILNKMFFSPMAAYSRLELVNPLWYTKLPIEIRKEAARDIGGTLAAVAGLLGGVKLAAAQAGIPEDQVDVSFDPAHTHFGRLKVGHTYYDFGGLTPMIRTAYRIISGRKVTPKGGEYALPGGLMSKYQGDLPEAPFGQSAFGELSGFVENKTSPIYHAGKGVLTGRSRTGQPYELSNFLVDMFAPISLEGAGQAYSDYDATEAAKQLPDILGMSTMTETPEESYPARSKKGKKGKVTYAF